MNEQGAAQVKLVYNALAAAAIAEAQPERQRHPLRRALQWTVEEGAAAQWWVKPD